MLTSQRKRQNLFAIIGHYFGEFFVFFEKKSKGDFLFVKFFSQVQCKVKFISKIFSDFFDFFLKINRDLTQFYENFGI